jgi:hypothetical protein
LELSGTDRVGDAGIYPWNDVMTILRRRRKAAEANAEPIELIVAPAAIQRALDVYEQLRPHDTSVLLQARKILTQHIFGMVDQGELDQQKLIVGGLARLKAVEREHGIKSAHVASEKPGKDKAALV